MPVPFCGRDAQMTALSEQLSRARGGAGAVVLVEGDAGMGKSRLLDEAAAEFDESGYRLHLSTLLGSASVIDEPALTSAKRAMLSECHSVAKSRQQSDCSAVAAVLLGMLTGGQK